MRKQEQSSQSGASTETKYKIPSLAESSDDSIGVRLLARGLAHILAPKERPSDRFRNAMIDAERRFAGEPDSPFLKDKIERLARFSCAGLMERAFAQSTAETVRRGKEDSEWYEAFDVQETVFEEESEWVWLNFPGLGSIDGQREIGVVPGGALDMIPPQGTGYSFVGPAAIAGYTPEQCRKVTEQVLARTREIVRQHPGKKVGVFCFSAGTHLGTYVANQLNKEHAEAGLDGPPPVQKFITAATGVSIAYGMQSTQVTDFLATDLEQRGITKYQYDEAIADLTQKENLEYLPKGENCLVFAAGASADGSHTGDSFIPRGMEGGTDDLVRLMQGKGLEPTYIVLPGKDHVTMPLHFIMEIRAGLDPYLLGTSLAEYMAKNPPPLDEEQYKKILDQFLKSFSREELQWVGDVLSGRDGAEGMQEYDAQKILTPEEQKLTRVLIEKGICGYRQWSMHPAAPHLLTVLEPPPGGVFQRPLRRIQAERAVAELTGFISELEEGRVPEFIRRAA